MTTKKCGIAGCQWKYKARGLCSSHYEAALREEHKTRPVKVYHSNLGKSCMVKVCHRPVRTMLLCEPHYKRKLKGEDVNENSSGIKIVAKTIARPRDPDGFWNWVKTELKLE
jgi:hypothetical protein